MSVTLAGRTYSYDEDFANWRHAGIKAGTGKRVFPDAIFEDFLAEVLLQKAGIASINGLAPGAAGNVAVSNGVSWVRSDTVTVTLLGGLAARGTTVTRLENSFAAVPAGAAGVGLELGIDTGAALFQSYNRTAAVYAGMRFNGTGFIFNQVTGPANDYAVQVSAVSGGLLISAGTSATDYALFVRSVGNTALMYVRGDGLTYFGGMVSLGSSLSAQAVTCTSVAATDNVSVANNKALVGLTTSGSPAVMAYVDTSNQVQLGAAALALLLTFSDPTLGSVSKRVQLGAADSAGAGYRSLRVPN